jgi:2-oxoglutarate ferredoxin oxidoreductase subunit delta
MTTNHTEDKISAAGGSESEASPKQKSKADKIANKAETTAEKRGKRNRVVIFGNWCKDCGICVVLCPRKVLELDATAHPVVAHPEKCTSCRWCEVHCPDFAIVVKELPVPK